ncbi:MAG: permease [Nanoarchaeota archaeon]|nr:permease [Nanoarchaeota archaeon]MBU4451639.1 permease [Nanoarchaeota archaeon]MCG2724076.1 permease [archaeon]
MLQIIVDRLLYSVLGLDASSALARSLNFFIYDSVKILLLLFGMIFLIGFLRTYIPQDKIKDWLGARKYGSGNVAASLFGAITPFCSCSSIPIFLGFLEAGVPIGAAFSFLITSPLVNEYLAVLMLGYFGWKITAAYVLSGIILGAICGMVLGRMNLEKHLAKDLITSHSKASKSIKYNGINGRLAFGLKESVSIVKKVGLWVIVGVGIGALIHNYVPSEFIQGMIDKGGVFTVPIVTLLGIPMYGSCAAIVPIAMVLFQKGVPLGTALAFMMATSALSMPEAVMLRRAMNLKLIMIFFGITALGIIFTGYLFNMLQYML